MIKKIRWLFIPFSFIYYLLVSLRNIFYNLHIFKENRLNAKVISVGNITWGGTGKTPTVLLILGELLEKKKKVAILTRGYGRDEERLISRRFPTVSVVVGKDRVSNGRLAINRYSVGTLLLDDGFQYRRLKRDLDIVCIDAGDPFGNRLVVPAGSMRECISCLKRADIFLITRVDLVKSDKMLHKLETKLKRLKPSALIVKSIHSPEYFYKLSDNQLIDNSFLKYKDIVLVSAIGNPYSFERIIFNFGLKIKRHFVFSDHYWYREKDLKRVERYCLRYKIDTVLITEKDAVKLRDNGQWTMDNGLWTNIYVLSIKLEIIENEEGFFNRLFGIYNS